MVTQKLVDMAQVECLDTIMSKHKVTTVFFPYAVWGERDGESGMMDAFLRVSRVSELGRMWGAITPFIPTLLDELSPRTIVLVSPYVPWHSELHDKNVVARWAAAASAVPYTEEVGQNVVDALLQIASVDSLRPHIPVDSWSWLNRQPSLPPICLGRYKGTKRNVIRQVRALGDIEILNSYFLLVWSEWDPTSALSGGLVEVQTSIREDFGGIEMRHHREVLIRRLDHVLGELDQGFGYLNGHNPNVGFNEIRWARTGYRKLKQVLLEVDGEAMQNPPTCTPYRLINLFYLLTPVDAQRPTRRSCVRSLPVSAVPCQIAPFDLGHFAFIPFFVRQHLSAKCLRSHIRSIWMPGFTYP